MRPSAERSAAPALRVGAIVAVGVAVRAAVAALVPITTDEAYYVDWARHLAPGYLDHPPLVAWLVAGPLRLFGAHELAVRLLPVALQAATTLLAASVARAWAGERAAVAAAVLLQAAPVFSLGAILATPDAPLAAAWVGAIWALERATRPRMRPGWFVAAGVFLGLAALSKLSAGLLALGLLAALAATAGGRRALRTPWPWLGAGVALAVASPMLLWNAQRGWPSLAFQARHGLRGGGFSAARLAGSLGAQAAYVSPLLLALAAAAAWRALAAVARRAAAGGAPRPGDAGPGRGGPGGSDPDGAGSAHEGSPAFAAAALTALPVVAFFTLAASFTPGALPHWPAPGWLSALLLLAPAAAASRGYRPAAWLGFALSAAVVLAVPVAPLLGRTPLDELRGWREAVPAARAAAPGARLAATHWMALGHLGWEAEEPLAYVSDRPCAASFYEEPPDPRPRLLVVADGLGPPRDALERLAGPLEERGAFTARAGGRAIRTYRFYLARPRP